MKKTVLISLLSIALISVSCVWASNRGKNGVSSSKEVSSQNLFDNQPITGLKATSSFDIYLSQGDHTSVSIQVPERLKENIDCTLQDGVLTLGLKDCPRGANLQVFEKLVATVVCNSLDYISLSGSIDLHLQSDITSCSPSFNLNMSGSSDFVGGNNILIINGTDARFSLEGSCDFEGSLKIAGASSFNLSGSSDFTSNLTSSSKVTLEMAGSCDLELSGSAPSMDLKASGSSDCMVSKFKVQTATIESYGSSDVYINASESLDVKASGSSDVHYRGSPKIKMATAGSATIQSR